jgi:hypothetical protein
MGRTAATARAPSQPGINLLDGGAAFVRTLPNGIADIRLAIRITHTDIHAENFSFQPRLTPIRREQFICDRQNTILIMIFIAN